MDYCEYYENETKMNNTTNKIMKYAEYLVILEFMKARLNVFQNICSADNVDFIVKSKSGNYYEILLKTINLEIDRNVKFSKQEFGFELKNNKLIALVLFMKDIEPAAYLIPFKVFENPNQYFINNDLGGRFDHISNWEIKIFTKAIPEFSKYAFNLTASQLI